MFGHIDQNRARGGVGVMLKNEVRVINRGAYAKYWAKQFSSQFPKVPGTFCADGVWSYGLVDTVDVKVTKNCIKWSWRG